MNGSDRVRQNIKKVREFRGLSQEELAVKIGIEQSRVSGYEGGRFSLSLEALLEIAQALEVAPGKLMEGIGPDGGVARRNGGLWRLQKVSDKDPVHVQIKAARRNLGLTAKSVAARIGVTKGYYSKIEAGQGGSGLYGIIFEVLGLEIKNEGGPQLSVGASVKAKG